MHPLEMYSDCSIDCKIASVSTDKVMYTTHFAPETFAYCIYVYHNVSAQQSSLQSCVIIRITIVVVKAIFH